MEEFPYNMAPIVQTKDKKRVGLELTLSVPDEEKLVSTLRNILVELCRFNCPPLMMRESLVVEGEMVYLLVLRAECESVMDELLRKLNSIEGVEKASLIPSDDFFLYSPKMYPPMFMGRRAVIAGQAIMEGMTAEPRKQLGRLAEIVINRMGYFVGKRIGELYGERLIRKKRHEEIKRFLEVLPRIAGWGKVSGYNVDRQGIIEIKVDDLWEKWAMDRNGIIGRPEYTIGLITGFFEAILGKPVETRYTKIWENGKESMLFFIKPE